MSLKRRRFQRIDPAHGDVFPHGGWPILWLGGMQRSRRLVRGELHARLELRARDILVPVRRAGPVDARHGIRLATTMPARCASACIAARTRPTNGQRRRRWTDGHAIMRLYRDWRRSGDDAMLEKLWPHARQAMEFAWIHNGWDEDKDGVMESASTTRWTSNITARIPEMGTYISARSGRWRNDGRPRSGRR